MGERPRAAVVGTGSELLTGTISDFCDMHGHWDDWAATNQLGLAAAETTGNRLAQGYMLR